MLSFILIQCNHLTVKQYPIVWLYHHICFSTRLCFININTAKTVSPSSVGFCLFVFPLLPPFSEEHFKHIYFGWNSGEFQNPLKTGSKRGQMKEQYDHERKRKVFYCDENNSDHSKTESQSHSEEVYKQFMTWTMVRGETRSIHTLGVQHHMIQGA